MTDAADTPETENAPEEERASWLKLGNLQFSLRTMVLVVVVLCVLFGVMAGYRQYRFAELVSGMEQHPDWTSSRSIALVMQLRAEQSQELLERFDRESPLRAWLPEEQIFFYANESLVQAREDGEYDAISFVPAGPGDLSEAQLGYVLRLRGSPRSQSQNFPLGLHWQGVEAGGKDAEGNPLVAVDFTLEDELADGLNVPRGQAWQARASVEEWLEFINQPDPEAEPLNEFNRPRMDWLLERVEMSPEEVVPGEEVPVEESPIDELTVEEGA